MRDLGPDGVAFDLGLKFSYKKKKKKKDSPWVFVWKENFERPGIFWGKKIQYVHVENLCNRF